ncbi:MAG: DUF1826 domain-containing protein [Luminiphilus sp.]
MSVLAALQEPAKTGAKTRRTVIGDDVSCLPEIYQDDVNMAIWNRALDPLLRASVTRLVMTDPSFQIGLMTTPRSVYKSLVKALPDSDTDVLAEDITCLVDMFSCLFEVEHVGLRLTVLRGAMCPRFHVDKVPCRLISTYVGPGTQWLEHQTVDRSKLGPSACSESDHERGTYTSEQDIRVLQSGAVGLLKGEAWDGNEGAGLVHRSPSVEGASRLLLTLDFGR